MNSALGYDSDTECGFGSTVEIRRELSLLGIRRAESRALELARKGQRSRVGEGPRVRRGGGLARREEEASRSRRLPFVT
jgi:hypothetical protein